MKKIAFLLIFPIMIACSAEKQTAKQGAPSNPKTVAITDAEKLNIRNAQLALLDAQNQVVQLQQRIQIAQGQFAGAVDAIQKKHGCTLTNDLNCIVQPKEKAASK